MKKKIYITINGKRYPAHATMGAMLRFKQETGKEASEIKADSPTDMVTYLYCCVKSASKHEGEPLELDLQDFADSITLDDITEWANNLFEPKDEQTVADGDASDEKKRQ